MLRRTMAPPNPYADSRSGFPSDQKSSKQRRSQSLSKKDLQQSKNQISTFMSRPDLSTQDDQLIVSRSSGREVLLKIAEENSKATSSPPLPLNGLLYNSLEQR